MITVEERIRARKVFTNEQRSLAWCPLPKPERFASDCRVGGSSGLDGIGGDSIESQIVIARMRLHREEA